MRIDILTLFPKMFEGPFSESIVMRAQEKGLLEIRIHDLRRWAQDARGTVDDRPYGGGTGMILLVELIHRALKALKLKVKSEKFPPKADQPLAEKVILLDPAGKPFNQSLARKLAKEKHLILVAGHYEGVDERVREHLVDEAISIGDYILTGGELPAMVVVDSLVRLIPGVLEKEEATKFESFANYHTLIYDNRKPSGLLEYPQYTRPEDYKGWKVPKILLSGNHKEIERWRKQKALERTHKLRPDLLKKNG